MSEGGGSAIQTQDDDGDVVAVAMKLNAQLSSSIIFYNIYAAWSVHQLL